MCVIKLQSDRCVECSGSCSECMCVLVDCSVVMLWTEAVTVYVKRGSTDHETC